jgi:hypothetical protein
VSKELRDVALRLLSAHATSTASERNWSLWGRIYCASPSSLGMERTKALIAICIRLAYTGIIPYTGVIPCGIIPV